MKRGKWIVINDGTEFFQPVKSLTITDLNTDSVWFSSNSSPTADMAPSDVPAWCAQHGDLRQLDRWVAREWRRSAPAMPKPARRWPTANLTNAVSRASFGFSQGWWYDVICILRMDTNALKLGHCLSQWWCNPYLMPKSGSGYWKIQATLLGTPWILGSSSLERIDCILMYSDLFLPYWIALCMVLEIHIRFPEWQVPKADSASREQHWRYGPSLEGRVHSVGSTNQEFSWTSSLQVLAGSLSLFLFGENPCERKAFFVSDESSMAAQSLQIHNMCFPWWL